MDDGGMKKSSSSHHPNIKKSGSSSGSSGSSKGKPIIADTSNISDQAMKDMYGVTNEMSRQEGNWLP